MKHLLFSLTAKDFRWDYFCTGGPGGQAQNRKKNGVRCTHEPSGASAEARESRSQGDNKELAFRRCAESKKFQQWIKLESSRRLGNLTPEQLAEIEVQRIMDKMATSPDFKFEIIDSQGKTVALTFEEFMSLT